jgi:PIN domain nuclease of toxin-antitoxin system
LNYLIDTQLLLWSAAKKDRLPPDAKRLMEQPQNGLWFSVVSIWEIAIKRSLNKPDFLIDANPLRAGLLRSRYVELAIESRNVFGLFGMPFHHNDPFDRLLVAQAKSEGMILLTADRELGAYGDSVLVV